MRVLTTAEGEVRALAFSPDGHALAAAVEHRGVFLWNLQSTGTPVRLDDRAEDRVGDLHFTPDGRSVGWLAGNRWKVYDRDTRTASRPRLAPGANLCGLVPYPDGSGL